MEDFEINDRFYEVQDRIDRLISDLKYDVVLDRLFNFCHCLATAYLLFKVIWLD